MKRCVHSGSQELECGEWIPDWRGAERKEEGQMGIMRLFTGMYMRLFCRAVVESAEVESVEAPLETWRKKERAGRF